MFLSDLFNDESSLVVEDEIDSEIRTSNETEALPGLKSNYVTLGNRNLAMTNYTLGNTPCDFVQAVQDNSKVITFDPLDI